MTFTQLQNKYNTFCEQLEISLSTAEFMNLLAAQGISVSFMTASLITDDYSALAAPETAKELVTA